MAPFAGRPPFATDLPDSFHINQPKPTPRPKEQLVDATALGGSRESAYTAFDTYFTSGNNTDSRASGVDDIGRDLMSVDSDDDSEDDPSQPKKKPKPTNGQPSDKHRALYAAATGVALPQSPPPSYEHGVPAPTRAMKRIPSPLQPSSTVRTVRQLQPVVHLHVNESRVSQHVEPSTPPGVGRPMAQQQQVPPSVLQAGGRPSAGGSPARLQQPQPPLLHGQDVTYSPPSPGFHGNVPGTPLTPTSRTPQPLPPPQTPIMPVFARPRRQSNSIKFDEKAGILRGNSEETLLPRGVGGKGDDFWRRFSMVAKESARSNSQKSAWLTKTESGSTSLAKWVWVVGILLLAAAGTGIGLGWYFTHNKPGAQPVAIGGSADEILTTTSSPIAVTSASVRPTKVTAASIPTQTSNNKRAVVPLAHRRAHASHI